MRTRPTPEGRSSRLAIGAAIAVGIAAVAGLAIAQQPRRKLHEDLPFTDTKPSPLIGGNGSGNPAAFQSGGKLLTEPKVDDARKTSEPLYGQDGFAADRETSMTPDGNTGSDSTLHYVSVFNPDVLPFKRMSAFDATASSYKLFVKSTVHVSVPVSGTADTDKTRDRFWGSLMIDLQPGKDIPLPSVAPDMRILSYRVKPKVRLEFSKDGADNFYVRSAEPNASGPHRLVFLVDADAGYFAPSLPTRGRQYTAAEVAQLAPNGYRHALPRDVQAQAEVTLRKLGLNSDMDLGQVFNKLVEYFRAFQAKPLPQSADIYRALCDNQAGVCRHRAFAFMITANAIGIPTRYVQNEAHAFVEVWFPDGRNWQRIDLGGAALRMQVTGADDKVLHRPRADDPFAKPPQYRNNYTQLEGEISGLTQQQLDDKKRSLDDAPASGQFDTQGQGQGQNGPDRITPDPTLPVVPNDPRKHTPDLEVIEADRSGYRGGDVTIAGRVNAKGKALPDHPVDVYLSPKGMQGANPIPLGRAVTGADGAFRQEFALPAQLDLQTYEIWLASPEDAYYNAALSN